MRLEDQVVSLELAKKLKELGVKQGSLFKWDDLGHRWSLEYDIRGYIGRYSAFTVAELGEMLPNVYYSSKVYSSDRKDMNYECAGHESGDIFTADTEANARAKMLIYLTENKLMEVSDAR